MAVLSTALRNQLSRAIVDARSVGESGARRALEALAVHHGAPYGSMSEDEGALRNRLRAHGRQLGDARDKTKGTQAIARLVREVAYEHWHRMLFARFLAENALLIEPASGVAITMQECEELARERAEDPWALAASFAQRMLPRIFRPDDAALTVTLAPETRQALEKLLAVLPAAVFTADDSLGWTYQFWQAAEKEAVNRRVKSGEKITGETLPAVTQLFTEHYMVQFLLHNTIGAWHAGKALTAEQREEAKSEQELRDVVSLAAAGGYQFEYLRFVREPSDGDDECASSGRWRPAAGEFKGWPPAAAALTVLDPCCGSGHFLVAAFELLVRLRKEEEDLALDEAIRAVIRDNLFGLELDPRCTQIAAFNLALAAWRMAGAVIELPPMRVACSGLGPQATREEWVATAERCGPAWAALSQDAKARVRGGLQRLHDTFRKAPELGSLIDPLEGGADLFTAGFDELQPFLQAAFEAEALDEEGHERAVAAKGMADAAEILVGPGGSGRGGYTLVVTNVPYLGRESHSAWLRTWAETNYGIAKQNLATIFVARLLGWIQGRETTSAGTLAAVTLWDWLFLTSYRGLREEVLRTCTWNVEARLGPKAFETIGGEVVGVSLLVISGSAPDRSHVMAGINAEGARTAAGKAACLRRDDAAGMSADEQSSFVAEPDGDESDLPPVAEERTECLPCASIGSVAVAVQAEQLNNPDSRITFLPRSALPLFGTVAECLQGLSTGDFERFGRRFWELAPKLADRWRLLQNAVDFTQPFRGREDVVAWSEVRTAAEQGLAALRGRRGWGSDGVALSQVSSLPATIFTGELFADSSPVIVPRDATHLAAVWCFAASPEFRTTVRAGNPKLSINNGYFAKIPFDLARWQRVAAERYPNGLPEPESDDPTQWLFHGHPAFAESSTVLQVAVARLLGYRWPPELDGDMRLSGQARTRAQACAKLAGFADDDGIVCLSSVRGEGTAADRVRSLLAAAFDGEWSAAREQDLLQAAAARFDSRGQPADTLDDWLRDRFFEEHCALFHKRPFIWHIWDGRRDGFNALVNYHKLAGPGGEGLRTLNTLAFTYLGEWIDRQRAEQKADVEGADARLAAAIGLQNELRRIIEGEPPCDLFVRWKPLRDQPLGWDPDINDGVRLNIRPFVLATDVRAKGAGVLRAKPDNTWSNSKKTGVTDRGKEPENLRPRAEYPWFWGCQPEKHPDHRVDFGAATTGAVPAAAKFDGIRWNGLHYTRAAKESARAAAERRAR